MHVTKALIETDRTIKSLQQTHQSKIKSVEETPEFYTKFEAALRTMSISGQLLEATSFLPIFWDQLPHIENLTGKVDNPFNPGDGIIYTTKELKKAEMVLKGYYNAWSEVATQESPALSDKLPKVKSMANMSKTCLVLKGMQRPDLLAHFCRRQKADVGLPLSVDELEAILQGDKARATLFATEQYRVVRRTWNDGEHIDIPEREPLPLKIDHHYASGSFGMVNCYQDVDSQEFFAAKQQLLHDTGKHLMTEIARLQKVDHLHIVQFVKSYRRGDYLGLLLKPAADTDLQKLLVAYSQYVEKKLTERVQELRPAFLTAFGCLSHGLRHIHSRKIRHKDIKPNNILFLDPKTEPARFLWADFGLAYDFEKARDSKTFNPSSYSVRYAAPENAETDLSVEVIGAAESPEIHTNLKTLDEHEHQHEHLESTVSLPEPKMPAHGRSADIFSFGCVFIETLRVLVSSKIPHYETPGFAFYKHIPDLQSWAEDHAKILDPADPLTVIFLLASQMITFEAGKRPTIEEVVSTLVDSSTPERFFCAACLPEVQPKSAN